MEELLTAPIPSPIRIEGQRQPLANAASRQVEKRSRTRSGVPEKNEEDEPVENTEPEHSIDVSA
jgi:hypothetical protein